MIVRVVELAHGAMRSVSRDTTSRSSVPGTTPCRHTTNARSALLHVTTRADDGDDTSNDDDGNDDDNGGDEPRKVGSHTRADGRGRTGGQAGEQMDGWTGGRRRTHARAVVRPGRRWDVRTVARVCALMSVGVPFVSYCRATPARQRAVLIEECIDKRGCCAVGRLKPRGPAILRSRSMRLIEAEAPCASQLVSRT